MLSRPPSSAVTSTPSKRHPVVHAAAAGLAHPVRGHDGDPGRRRSVQQRRVGRRSPQQHGIEAPQGRRTDRIGREPASAGSAPPTGSAGRPRSARARRSASSRASTSSDRTGGHQRAHQHHQTGDVVGRQGQHPGAGPAEPPVGGVGRGDQCRTRDSTTPRGRPVEPEVATTAAASASSTASLGSEHRQGLLALERDRPAAGRSRQSRPDCGAASPAPRRCRRRGGAGRSRLPPYAVCGRRLRD